LTADRYEPIDLRVAPNVGAVLSVRVSKELAVSLDEEARARGISLSDVIREALERRYAVTSNAAINVTWKWEAHDDR